MQNNDNKEWIKTIYTSQEKIHVEIFEDSDVVSKLVAEERGS